MKRSTFFDITDAERYKKLFALPKDTILTLVSLSEIERNDELDKLIKSDIDEVKTVSVTKVVTYNPEEYFNFCNEEGYCPTKKGFLEYIEDWIREDFTSPTGLNYKFIDDNE